MPPHLPRLMAHPYLAPHSHDPGRWVFVPRAAYDRVVDRFPRWMADVWPHLVKDWRLGGAAVKLPTHAGHLHDMRGVFAHAGVEIPLA